MWQMHPPHCVCVVFGVPEIVQNNCNVVKISSYSNSCMCMFVFNFTHVKKLCFGIFMLFWIACQCLKLAHFRFNQTSCKPFYFYVFWKLTVEDEAIMWSQNHAHSHIMNDVVAVASSGSAYTYLHLYTHTVLCYIYIHCEYIFCMHKHKKCLCQGQKWTIMHPITLRETSCM